MTQIFSQDADGVFEALPELPGTDETVAAFEQLRDQNFIVGSPGFGVITPPAGLPGASFLTAANVAQTVNRDHFVPFVCTASTQVGILYVNVAAGPASDANVRFGIYRAAGNYEPASLVYDGAQSVATAFTGVKSHTPTFGDANTLDPGFYLLGTNIDVAMTFTTYPFASVAGVFLLTDFSAVVNAVYKSRTYGAFPDPGSWDTLLSSAVFGWRATALMSFNSLVF